jgi:hypothetical protein
MLDNNVSNDRIRNDEVANILFSLNRKNTLDSSCNDKEDNNGEGENKGDTNDNFDANVNTMARELGKKSSLAEECGVYDWDGQYEDNSKATIDINSLTPKSVPAGAKKILFGRYVLNIYVGIV